MLVKDKIEYTVSLVSDFAKKHALANTQAFNHLDRFGSIGFIDRHYDTAHTLPFTEMLENLALYCRNNGGTL